MHIFLLCHFNLQVLHLFSGANTIIRSTNRRFAEPLNVAHLPRTHADRHGNRVVPRNVRQHVLVINVVLRHH